MSVDLRLQRLDALLEDHPGWRPVLAELGITGREGTAITLAAAADRANVDVEAVLAAMSGPTQQGWRCDRVSEAPLSGLIRHIEEVHHVLLREQFAEIADVLRAERRANPDDGQLAAVDDAFAAFRSDTESHLAVEETVLFPLCRDLIDAFSWPSFHTGPIGDPIRTLVHDHDHVSHLLGEVVEICEPGSGLERLLDEVSGDLGRHLAEENDLLFPAVLRLADEVAAS